MDKYKELREAAAAATPGPWVSDYKEGETDPDCPDVTIWAVEMFEGQFVSNICFDNCPANGRYIAAANPATVQTLLAERDALRDLVASANNSIGGSHTIAWQQKARAALSL